MPEHPGERDLAQGNATRLGDLPAEPLDHADVRLEIVAAEDGLAEGHAVAAPVAGGVREGRRGGENPGEKTVTERAGAHDAHTVGEAGRERRLLLAAAEQWIAPLGG